MRDELSYLLRYLDSENIKLRNEDLVFQLESHPDFPSLLAISDTLTFFKINNGALHVPISDIHLLPDHFIALLDEETDLPTMDSKLHLIERRNDNYYCFDNKKWKEVDQTSIHSRWRDTVLLIEGTGNEQTSARNHTILASALLSIVFVIYLITLVNTDLQSKLFIGFSFAGVAFSAFALKDLFNVHSTWVDKLCTINSSADCNTIVHSKKWRIFKLLNLSDLSLVFFAGQLFSFLALSLPNKSGEFLGIQFLILLPALPITLLSLYYQKFVEKKWCLICLGIITLIISELVYIYSTRDFSLQLSFQSVSLTLIMFSLSGALWTILKQKLSTYRRLKNFELKSTRFLHNYNIFKNTLVSRRKVEFPPIPIVLGNNEAKTQITIITNPFCSYCKDVHKLLNELLERYPTNINIQIMLRTDLHQDNDDKKALFRSLINTYLHKNIEVFHEALDFSYDMNNIQNWLRLYAEKISHPEPLDEVYLLHNIWCIDNGFNFTPALFINGYLYPSEYEKELLPYFMNELIEDSF